MSLPVVEIAAKIEADQRAQALARLRLLFGWTSKICRNRFTNRLCVSRPGKMPTCRIGKARQDAQHDDANHGEPYQGGGGKRLKLILHRSTHRILASTNCGLPVGDYL